MSNRISLVLSSTALVVAVLGATPVGEAAWEAVGNVPPNSVGTAHLKRNAVTSPKVKNKLADAPRLRAGRPAQAEGEPGAEG